MAINQHHICEEVNGVRCAIVEKYADEKRIQFLKDLLVLNGFEVEVGESTPPKGMTPEQFADLPKTFTIGVTDVRFNPINAIFGRLLKSKDGRVVTLPYWQQKDAISDDTIPYFEN